MLAKPMNRGARDIAEYFTGLGITCFVLRYRLPGEGWENRETVCRCRMPSAPCA